MWQELRDYWLPLMLFGGVLLLAALLLALVVAAPYLHTAFEHYSKPQVSEKKNNPRAASYASR